MQISCIGNEGKGKEGRITKEHEETFWGDMFIILIVVMVIYFHQMKHFKYVDLLYKNYIPIKLLKNKKQKKKKKVAENQ